MVSGGAVFFASRVRSATDFKGDACGTRNSMAVEPTPDTGVKLLTGSYGSVLIRLLATNMTDEPISSV